MPSSNMRKLRQDINLPMFTYQSHNPRFLLELVGVGSHMSLLSASATCRSHRGQCDTVVEGALAPLGRVEFLRASAEGAPCVAIPMCRVKVVIGI